MSNCMHSHIERLHTRLQLYHCTCEKKLITILIQILILILIVILILILVLLC